MWKLFVALLAIAAVQFAKAEIPEVEAIVLPSGEVTLSLPVEATIRELRVKEGQFVKKGDVLAILYSPIEALEAERANKQKELAGYHLGVSKRLQAGSIVSDESARQQQVDFDIAEIEAKRAAAVLDDKTLFAPFDSYVLRIYKSPGETVGRIEKIVELVDYATLNVDAYLESEWLGKIKAGDSAQVSILQFDQKPLDAKVTLVDPVVDPGSGLFRVRVELNNEELKIPSGVPAHVIFAAPKATSEK